MGARSLVALLPLSLGGCFLVPIAAALSDGGRPSTELGTPAENHGALGVGQLRSPSEWRPVDHVTAFVLDGDARLADTPLWFASYFTLAVSGENPEASVPEDGSTTFVDFGFGVRHYRAFGPVEPFVGAGALLGDRAIGGSSGDYAYTIGCYAEAGLRVALHPCFGVGVLARGHVSTGADLDGHDYATEGTTLLFEVVYRH